MIWRSAGQLGDNSWSRLSPNIQEFSFVSFSLRILLFIHQFFHFLHFILAVLTPVLALMLLFTCLTNGPNYFLYVHALLGNIVSQWFYYLALRFIILLPRVCTLNQARRCERVRRYAYDWDIGIETESKLWRLRLSIYTHRQHELYKTWVQRSFLSSKQLWSKIFKKERRFVTLWASVKDIWIELRRKRANYASALRFNTMFNVIVLINESACWLPSMWNLMLHTKLIEWIAY